MGCSSIVDPRSAPTTTTVPAATDSIYSTTPNVVLRPGDPLTVSVNVVSLPNAPLDLYILMDLSDSMAAPLATVKSISQLIAQQVSSITTNVRIGFGAFNDKPTYPYSPQTPAGCLPGRDAPDCSDRRAGTRQYSFLHLVNFTSIFTDYPSVGLVASLLKKYDVIPIFGIVPITSSTLLINNTFLSSYQALQDLMTSVGTKAFARPISSSASDVLDVIKTVYQEVIQNIAITLPTQSDVAVSLSQITCPSALTFSVPGFGTTTISVDKVCSCSCDKNVTVNAQQCNFRGNFSCGGCMCIAGWGQCACGSCECDATPYSWKWQGKACECPGSNYSDCFDTTFKSGPLCSGNGMCSCNSSGKGMCVCSSGYTGTYCESKIIPVCLPIPTCILADTCNISMATSSGQQVAKTCNEVSGACTYSYDLFYDKQVIRTTKVCTSELNIKIIIPAVICGLLFLFVIICAIIKIILVMLDYVEVRRWEKDLKEADFSKNQNPLYQSPEMQYTNVAYGKTI
eukprot:Em0004g125a